MVTKVRHPAPRAATPKTPSQRKIGETRTRPQAATVLKDSFVRLGRALHSRLIAGATLTALAAQKIQETAAPMLREARHHYQQMRLSKLQQDAATLPPIFAAKLAALSPQLAALTRRSNLDQRGEQLDHLQFLISEYASLARLPAAVGLSTDAPERYQAAWATAVEKDDVAALQQILNRHQILVQVDRIQVATDKITPPDIVKARLALIMDHVTDLNAPIHADASDADSNLLNAVSNAAELVDVYRTGQDTRAAHGVDGAARVATMAGRWAVEQFETHYEDLWLSDDELKSDRGETIEAAATRHGKAIGAASALARTSHVTRETRDAMLIALEKMDTSAVAAKRAQLVIRHAEERVIPRERVNVAWSQLDSRAGSTEDRQLHYTQDGWLGVASRILNDNPITQAYQAMVQSGSPLDKQILPLINHAFTKFVDARVDQPPTAESIALATDADWKRFAKQLGEDASELAALEKLVDKAEAKLPPTEATWAEKRMAFVMQANDLLGVEGRGRGHATEEQLRRSHYDISLDMIRVMREQQPQGVSREFAGKYLAMFKDETAPADLRRMAATVYEYYLIQQQKRGEDQRARELARSDYHEIHGEANLLAIETGGWEGSTWYGTGVYQAPNQIHNATAQLEQRLGYLQARGELVAWKETHKAQLELIREYGNKHKTVAEKTSYVFGGWVKESYRAAGLLEGENATVHHINQLLFQLERAEQELNAGQMNRYHALSAVESNGVVVQRIAKVSEEAQGVIAYRDMVQGIVCMALATAATGGVGAELGLTMRSGKLLNDLMRAAKVLVRVVGKQATFLNVDNLGKLAMRGHQDLYDVNRSLRYNLYNLGVQIAEFELMGRAHRNVKGLWKVKEATKYATTLRTALARGAKFTHEVVRDTAFFHSWTPFGSGIRGFAHMDMAEIQGGFEALASEEGFRHTLVFTFGMGVPLGHPLSQMTVKYALKHSIHEMKSVAQRQEKITALDQQVVRLAQRGAQDRDTLTVIAQLRHQQAQMAAHNARVVEKLAVHFNESEELKQQALVMTAQATSARFNALTARHAELTQKLSPSPQPSPLEGEGGHKFLRTLRKAEREAHARAVLAHQMQFNGNLPAQAAIAIQLEATHLRNQRQLSENSGRIEAMTAALTARTAGKAQNAPRAARLALAYQKHAALMREANALMPGRFAPEAIDAIETQRAALLKTLGVTPNAELAELQAAITTLQTQRHRDLATQVSLVQKISEAGAVAAQQFLETWRRYRPIPGLLSVMPVPHTPANREAAIRALNDYLTGFSKPTEGPFRDFPWPPNRFGPEVAEACRDLGIEPPQPPAPLPPLPQVIVDVVAGDRPGATAETLAQHDPQSVAVTVLIKMEDLLRVITEDRAPDQHPQEMAQLRDILEATLGLAEDYRPDGIRKSISMAGAYLSVVKAVLPVELQDALHYLDHRYGTRFLRHARIASSGQRGMVPDLEFPRGMAGGYRLWEQKKQEQQQPQAPGAITDLEATRGQPQEPLTISQQNRAILARSTHDWFELAANNPDIATELDPMEWKKSGGDFTTYVRRMTVIAAAETGALTALRAKREGEVGVVLELAALEQNLSISAFLSRLGGRLYNPNALVGEPAITQLREIIDRPPTAQEVEDVGGDPSQIPDHQVLHRVLDHAIAAAARQDRLPTVAELRASWILAVDTDDPRLSPEAKATLQELVGSPVTPFLQRQFRVLLARHNEAAELAAAHAVTEQVHMVHDPHVTAIQAPPPPAAHELAGTRVVRRPSVPPAAPRPELAATAGLPVKGAVPHTSGAEPPPNLNAIPPGTASPIAPTRSVMHTDVSRPRAAASHTLETMRLRNVQLLNGNQIELPRGLYHVRALNGIETSTQSHQMHTHDFFVWADPMTGEFRAVGDKLPPEFKDSGTPVHPVRITVVKPLDDPLMHDVHRQLTEVLGISPTDRVPPSEWQRISAAILEDPNRNSTPLYRAIQFVQAEVARSHSSAPTVDDLFVRRALTVVPQNESLFPEEVIRSLKQLEGTPIRAANRRPYSPPGIPPFNVGGGPKASGFGFTFSPMATGAGLAALAGLQHFLGDTVAANVHQSSFTGAAILIGGAALVTAAQKLLSRSTLPLGVLHKDFPIGRDTAGQIRTLTLPMATTTEFGVPDAARDARRKILEDWVDANFVDSLESNPTHAPQVMNQLIAAMDHMLAHYQARAAHTPLEKMPMLHAEWERETAVFVEIETILRQRYKDCRRLLRAAGANASPALTRHLSTLFNLSQIPEFKLLSGDWADFNATLSVEADKLAILEEAANAALADNYSPPPVDVDYTALSVDSAAKFADRLRHDIVGSETSVAASSVAIFAKLVKTGKIAPQQIHATAKDLAHRLNEGNPFSQVPIDPHTLLFYMNKLLGLSPLDWGRHHAKTQEAHWENEIYTALMARMPRGAGEKPASISAAAVQTSAAQAPSPQHPELLGIVGGKGGQNISLTGHHRNGQAVADVNFAEFNRILDENFAPTLFDDAMRARRTTLIKSLLMAEVAIGERRNEALSVATRKTDYNTIETTAYLDRTRARTTAYVELLQMRIEAELRKELGRRALTDMDVEAKRNAVLAEILSEAFGGIPLTIPRHRITIDQQDGILVLRPDSPADYVSIDRVVRDQKIYDESSTAGFFCHHSALGIPIIVINPESDNAWGIYRHELQHQRKHATNPLESGYHIPAVSGFFDHTGQERPETIATYLDVMRDHFFVTAKDEVMAFFAEGTPPQDTIHHLTHSPLYDLMSKRREGMLSYLRNDITDLGIKMLFDNDAAFERWADGLFDQLRNRHNEGITERVWRLQDAMETIVDWGHHPENVRQWVLDKLRDVPFEEWRDAIEQSIAEAQREPFPPQQLPPPTSPDDHHHALRQWVEGETTDLDAGKKAIQNRMRGYRKKIETLHTQLASAPSADQLQAYRRQWRDMSTEPQQLLEVLDLLVNERIARLQVLSRRRQIIPNTPKNRRNRGIVERDFKHTLKTLEMHKKLLTTAKTAFAELGLTDLQARMDRRLLVHTAHAQDLIARSIAKAMETPTAAAAPILASDTAATSFADTIKSYEDLKPYISLAKHNSSFNEPLNRLAEERPALFLRYTNHDIAQMPPRRRWEMAQELRAKISDPILHEAMSAAITYHALVAASGFTQKQLKGELDYLLKQTGHHWDSDSPVGYALLGLQRALGIHLRPQAEVPAPPQGPKTASKAESSAATAGTDPLAQTKVQIEALAREDFDGQDPDTQLSAIEEFAGVYMGEYESLKTRLLSLITKADAGELTEKQREKFDQLVRKALNAPEEIRFMQDRLQMTAADDLAWITIGNKFEELLYYFGRLHTVAAQMQGHLDDAGLRQTAWRELAGPPRWQRTVLAPDLSMPRQNKAVEPNLKMNAIGGAILMAQMSGMGDLFASPSDLAIIGGVALVGAVALGAAWKKFSARRTPHEAAAILPAVAPKIETVGNQDLIIIPPGRIDTAIIDVAAMPGIQFRWRRGNMEIRDMRKKPASALERLRPRLARRLKTNDIPLFINGQAPGAGKWYQFNYGDHVQLGHRVCVVAKSPGRVRRLTPQKGTPEVVIPEREKADIVQTWKLPPRDIINDPKAVTVWTEIMQTLETADIHKMLGILRGSADNQVISVDAEGWEVTDKTVPHTSLIKYRDSRNYDVTRRAILASGKHLYDIGASVMRPADGEGHARTGFPTYEAFAQHVEGVLSPKPQRPATPPRPITPAPVAPEPPVTPPKSQLPAPLPRVSHDMRVHLTPFVDELLATQKSARAEARRTRSTLTQEITELELGKPPTLEIVRKFRDTVPPKGYKKYIDPDGDATLILDLNAANIQWQATFTEGVRQLLPKGITPDFPIMRDGGYFIPGGDHWYWGGDFLRSKEENAENPYQGRIFFGVDFSTDPQRNIPKASILYAELTQMAQAMRKVGISVQFKLTSHRKGRNDAGVLYFHAKDQTRILHEMRRISKLNVTADRLPLFVAPLTDTEGNVLPGIGFAQHPRGDSFGARRTRALEPVMDALAEERETGVERSREEIEGILAAALEARGIDPDVPAFDKEGQELFASLRHHIRFSRRGMPPTQNIDMGEAAAQPEITAPARPETVEELTAAMLEMLQQIPEKDAPAPTEVRQEQKKQQPQQPAADASTPATSPAHEYRSQFFSQSSVHNKPPRSAARTIMFELKRLTFDMARHFSKSIPTPDVELQFADTARRLSLFLRTIETSSDFPLPRDAIRATDTSPETSPPERLRGYLRVLYDAVRNKSMLERIIRHVDDHAAEWQGAPTQYSQMLSEFTAEDRRTTGWQGDPVLMTLLRGHRKIHYDLHTNADVRAELQANPQLVVRALQSQLELELIHIWDQLAFGKSMDDAFMTLLILLRRIEKYPDLPRPSDRPAAETAIEGYLRSVYVAHPEAQISIEENLQLADQMAEGIYTPPPTTKYFDLVRPFRSPNARSLHNPASTPLQYRYPQAAEAGADDPIKATGKLDDRHRGGGARSGFSRAASASSPATPARTGGLFRQTFADMAFMVAATEDIHEAQEFNEMLLAGAMPLPPTYYNYRLVQGFSSSIGTSDAPTVAHNSINGFIDARVGQILALTNTLPTGLQNRREVLPITIRSYDPSRHPQVKEALIKMIQDDVSGDTPLPESVMKIIQAEPESSELRWAYDWAMYETDGHPTIADFTKQRVTAVDAQGAPAEIVSALQQLVGTAIVAVRPARGSAPK